MKNILFTFLFTLFFVAQSFGQNGNAISNQILVRMQSDQHPLSMIKNIPQHIDLSVDRNLSKHADIWLLTFNETQTNLTEVIKIVKKEPTVLYVQPNRKVELRAAPNDPLYSNQWHHENIDSELAWDITTGGTTPNGKEIVVALIESADLINHTDLQDNHWKNTAEIPNNGIDDDGNGYIDDYNGWNVSTNNDNIGQGAHGTSCAGMMGAKGNNDSGVSGVNWDLKIMDIAGYANPFTEANIVESYDYALNARILWNQTNGASGAFVVATSSSWGIDGGNPANFPIWCSFYDDLGQAGILNVGATTNQNQDVDVFGDVPTACASDYMISVTATNSSDEIDFAGYGDQTIDLAAPGSSIYTTRSNNLYGTTSGTSFACPLTAGVIGLMYSVPCSNLESMAFSDPSGTAEIVRNALFNGVDQTPHLQARTVKGGRVNVKNAIDILMSGICSSCISPDHITTEIVNDHDASISFHQSDSASNYQVNIQVEGSGNWSNYTISDTTYTYTGLTSCTTYSYYVSSICAGEIGSPSVIQSFTTTGCGNCIALNYCPTGTNANPSSTFTVHSPSSISGNYTYQGTSNFGGNVENGYVFGELILVDDGTASPTLGCGNLNNAAALNGNIAVVERGGCTFLIKAMNAQNAGATAIIVINNGPGTIEMGGINNSVSIPAVMISQADGNILMSSINNGDQPEALLGIQNEWIEAFQIDGNNFTSGDNNGYFFNGNTFLLNAGQNYPFTLTPGYDGQSINQYTRIWIDLNQNGVFDPSELIYDQGTSSLGVLNGDFTIPTNSLLGNTRMRVQMAYQGYGASALPNVCGDFTSGEVEDYCIKIRSGISCGMNITPSVTDPTCNELQNGAITLNVSGGSPGYSYDWNNGMSVGNISNLNTNNYSVTITDATGCDTTLDFSLIYDRQLAINESIISPTCSGTNDGSISVNATGSSNFNYQWNNGPSSNTWSNIQSGNYQVTATDNDGCKITASYILSSPFVKKPTASFTADNYYLMIEFNNDSQNANSYEWDFDDGNTSTNFEPTHTYINEGNYNVCLTAIGDCDTSVQCNTIIVERDVTDLDKDSYNLGLKLFPNPASKSVTIQKESEKIEKAIIYASNGKIISSIQLSDNSTKFSIDNWSPGIYYFHFFSDQNEFLITKRLSVIR